ncbi:hypothetical protein EJ08DRAFT_179989 [Tothia fuscella]|uniref:Uncharacterized protein n=1 Tax=Tothia fuscella TaxID=1048955 RepID=A0A9P4NUK4_9PEZI|nr:hypothetical protein EJ08DRAFT_179989 [Tothia fuscella]
MATPLAACAPVANSGTISQIIAFPTSLAALRPKCVRWNATCWVADQRLDPFEEYWISRFAFPEHQRTPHIEWCHFASDDTSRVSLYTVFPNLKTSFRAVGVMEKWTDQVVIPAFRKYQVNAGILSTSFNVIRLTGEAEREETLNVNAPDFALREVLTKKNGLQTDDLDGIWTSIRATANSNSAWGFQELFLVTVYHHDSTTNSNHSIEESWRSACTVWDAAVDMSYVPIESVRSQSILTLGAQVGGDQSVRQSSPARPAFRSVPSDVGRKRRHEPSEAMSRQSRFRAVTDLSDPFFDVDQSMEE